MNVQEYESKLLAIEKQYKISKNQLHKEFAISNNTIVVGDVIEDYIGKIKVESISTGISIAMSNLPCCIYTGVVLTKAGTPSKRNEKRVVWQTKLKQERN